MFKMTSMFQMLSSVLFLVLVIGETGVFGLPGESVVLEAIEAVEKADLFESDYGFLKRWAYVETQFGQLSGFRGGIWRIDNQQLKDTQMEAQNINGSVWREKINETFGINWVNVELKDLEKPLVSCLAARILLLMTRSPPPVLLVDQASVYQTLKVKDKKASNAYKNFIAKVTEYEMVKALEAVGSEQSNGQKRSVDTSNITAAIVCQAKPSLAGQRNVLTVDAEHNSTGNVQQKSLFKMYKIKTGGLSAKAPFHIVQDSGIYDNEDRKVIGFQQGYNIITIDKGQFVRKTFYIWKHETQEMATYLKAIPHGKTVIIATMDEPSNNRFSNGIADLIYDIGGSRSVFGGDMRYRSVYVLVGQKGAGTGKGKEYYWGAADHDSNAWFITEFYVSGDKMFSENGVAHVLLATIKFLGSNAKQYPSSEEVYELSPSKPFEVEDMQETRKRNRVNLKASFYF